MASEKVQPHLDRLEKMRSRLDTLLDSVPERLWDTRLYSDGAQWTLRQLLIHLMVSDRGQNSIVKSVADGKELIPADYDLERFNKSSVEKRAETPVNDARQALTASRAELIDWLNNIDDAALDKIGRHASLKVLTIGQMLTVMAMHESAHADDIERFLKENG